MNIIGINDSVIEVEHLPHNIQSIVQNGKIQTVGTLAETVLLAEKEAILKALAFTRHAKKETARLLGISTTTLWRKMIETGIENAPPLPEK